jgi:glycosyltransferase involved in cell wall biosynthesis
VHPAYGAPRMIVSFTWPSSYHRTGGVVVLYRFANGLARRGHEVHFIHGPAWPDRIESVDELGWFEFDDRVQHHIVDSLLDPSLPSGDVIFSAASRPSQGLPSLFIQGARMLSEDIERTAYRLRGPKVCVSRWLIGVGLRYGVPEEQLWHVPLGLDHELFRVHTSPDERRYDVAVTYHTHPTKGWNVGLRALHELQSRRPDLRVAVFGGGGIPDRVEDWMDFNEYPHHEVLVEEVYNASRVFLQPSNLEGFGFTCIEAMACGAALVTTDNGGSDEYARAGETALVVPPGDVDGLATAIGELLDDEPRRAAIAAAGQRFVRRFDWEVGTDVLEKHLLAYVDDPERFRRAPAAWGEHAEIW